MVGQGGRKGDDEFQHTAEKTYWQDCLEVEIIYFTRGKYCLSLNGGQTSSVWPVHLGFVKVGGKIWS